MSDILEDFAHWQGARQVDDGDAKLLASAATFHASLVAIAAKRLTESLRALTRAAKSGSTRAIAETTKDVELARDSLKRAMRRPS